MRKPIGLFVAAFATVAGGGLAFAVEGTPSAEEPPGLHDPVDDTFEVDADSLVPADDDVVEVQTTEADEAVVTDSPPEDTHGAAVSAAAHECSHDDPEVTHGECVSAVARDHDGDGTPDHGPGSPGFVPDAADTEDADEADEDEAEEADEGHGRGEGHGNGHGHEGDEAEDD